MTNGQLIGKQQAGAAMHIIRSIVKTSRARAIVLGLCLVLPTTGAIAQAPPRPAAPAAAVPAVAAPATPAPKCDATTPAAKAWLADNQWRYGNPDDPDPAKAKAARDAAFAAFNAIETGQSPWPNWFIPADSVLPAGTRFQMAMGPAQPTSISKYGQSDSEPGGWGTFNNIRTVQDVRDYLAVLPGFKPEIDRINTYVVVIPMPVQMGPVGPQIDTNSCSLLPGGWSQFTILAGRLDRIKYLALESSRKVADFR